MLGFDFEIQYKPGCENKAANALSRNPSFEGMLQAVTVSQIEGLEGVEQEVAKNEKLQSIIHDLLNNSEAPDGYHLRNGRLLYHDRLVLPKTLPSSLNFSRNSTHHLMRGTRDSFERTREQPLYYSGKE